MQKAAELVFIPPPAVGHLTSTLEIARLLVERDRNLSITVLIIEFPNFDSNFTSTFTRPLERIQFIYLPTPYPSSSSSDANNPRYLVTTFIESQKPRVKETVITKFTQPDSPTLAGFVLDMFCTCMIDVADDLGVPSYIFFTSGAAFLGLMFHALHLHDDLGTPTTDLKDSDTELVVPSFQNPIPVKVLPTVMLNKDWSIALLEYARRFRRTKGIMVNTFTELESYAVNSLLTNLPTLYSVGPILNLEGDQNYDVEKKSEIMAWLDDQPESSVVFLCFGSMGSFGVDQVKEIACALEQSGHRFLWSLRKSPPKDKDKFAIPSDYENLTDVLPDGFLDRTAGIGKVIGWAPQVDVLAHPAVGGFVSHCGWNSTLESIWFGVPIATLPMYAEQQLNAFEMVRELGLAVEIKMDCRTGFMMEDEVVVVSAEEIERGIRCLMESDTEVRTRVKEMSVMSKNALIDEMQKAAELVFIPQLAVGHLTSTLEIAKLLVERDRNLSITVLIIKFPNSDSNFTSTYTRPLDRIQFIDLPTPSSSSSSSDANNPWNFITTYIESQKPHVKEAVTTRFSQPDSPTLAGFVLDMFCTHMIDVADELGVPSYIFFTSGAAFLGLMFHAQHLHDNLGTPTTDLKDSDTELVVPSLQNPVPIKVLPSVMFNKDWSISWHEHTRRFRRAKGIMVNTFTELESYAVHSLSTNFPTLYPVGPILNLKGDNDDVGKKSEIMEWLDDQPESSVVFLCFGSVGSFGVDQVKEIACALEQSGHRFLWSLRKSPPKHKIAFPNDYENLRDVLPDGFLDRTAGIGKVIGWAPQVSVLAHPAVGGFVSHCGWNSMLESIWFGVPIATWPMYAEQQINAFEMVRELGLAVEIKMDYRRELIFMTEDEVIVVSSEEIERGIRCLMKSDTECRTRVKEMSAMSRNALTEGGSSFSSLGRFIADARDNISQSKS